MGFCQNMAHISPNRKCGRGSENSGLLGIGVLRLYLQRQTGHILHGNRLNL